MASYVDTILGESTLLHYWQMNETSGTTLANSKGSTPIALGGAPALARAGLVGNAVLFHGSPDFGITNNGGSNYNLDLTAQGKVVVEALVNLPAAANSDKMAWEFSVDPNANVGAFNWNEDASGGAGSIVLNHGNGGWNYAAYTRPTASTWHLIHCVYNNPNNPDEVDFYVDGVLQTPTSRPATSTNTNNFGNFPLYIACRYANSLFANMTIQHLAVYSDLAPARMAAHYATAIASMVAGTLSESSQTDTTVTVAWTSATGGTAPITAQLQRSPHGAGTWSNVTGATASPATDSGLTPSTGYDYRVLYTDSASNTAYSNVVTVTTNGNTTTYTVLQTDLWDNGYDNVQAPRQSTNARFIFVTDAATVNIGGTCTIYGSYPQYAHLGVRINGVVQSPLVFPSNGSTAMALIVGTVGTQRTVEITAGVESDPSGTVLGNFIDSVNYPNGSYFRVQAPTVGTRALIYGDSIAAGGNATNPESQSFAMLLRDSYGYGIMLEAWGYRSFHDDANTGGLRTDFVARLVGYSPTFIWLAIGTNDYGLAKWSATDFGTAYAAVLDALHGVDPGIKIICQTPILRSTETANGFGNTLGDYRTAIATACSARPWATLVDGTQILTTGDLDDGTHPTTTGHAKYAAFIAGSGILSNSAPTLTGYSSGPTVAYYRNITIANDTPAYDPGYPMATFSVSPALPAGLSININTGVISGKPTGATAAANHTVTLSNGVGSPATYVMNITVNQTTRGGVWN